MIGNNASGDKIQKQQKHSSSYGNKFLLDLLVSAAEIRSRNLYMYFWTHVCACLCLWGGPGARREHIFSFRFWWIRNPIINLIFNVARGSIRGRPPFNVRIETDFTTLFRSNGLPLFFDPHFSIALRTDSKWDEMFIFCLLLPFKWYLSRDGEKNTSIVSARSALRSNFYIFFFFISLRTRWFAFHSIWTGYKFQSSDIG